MEEIQVVSYCFFCSLRFDSFFCQHAPEKVVVILVGNKLDLEEQRAIPQEKGQELADHYGIHFYETSAKTGENLDMIFVDGATAVLKQPPTERIKSIKLDNKQHNRYGDDDKKAGCC
jgi:GTPase SAR1 family protein